MKLLYRGFIDRALELVVEIKSERVVNVQDEKLEFLTGYLEGGLEIIDKFGGEETNEN